MNNLAEIIDAEQFFAQHSATEDYIDESGCLVCGHCHTRKQTRTELFGTIKYMPVACECRKAQFREEDAEREREEFRQRLERLRRDNITDEKYFDYTFANDDGRFPDKSRVCRKYVENWEQMKAENIGILLSGEVGNGKTFLAGCIANALIDKCVEVSITSFSTLLRKMSIFKDNQELIRNLQKYELLVIDDLGAERETSTACEQVYAIVDAKYRSKTPLIITTNLSLSQLEKPKNLTYKRIYDRVLEMCPIQLVFNEPSRRIENRKAKVERAKKILRGEV